MPEYQTRSEQQTRDLAARLAREAKPGDVFLLEGSLGAGKSVFARAFIQTLCGADTDVPSPTFTLAQIYESPLCPLWHFDLYRLEDPEEIYETGWEDALNGAIVLVEWPQRLGPHIPPGSRTIRIETLGPESRKIAIDD